MTRPPLLYLRARHRQALWVGPLWVAIAAVGVDVLWTRHAENAYLRWDLLAGAAAVAVIVRFLGARSLRATGRALDRNAPSQNRWEAIAEVAGRTDPFAEALRGETADFLRTCRTPPAFGWYAGLALLVILAGFDLAAVNRVSVSVTPPRRAEAAARPVPPPTPAAPPPAAIRWLSPQPVITAAPDEVVPLWAVAESRLGLASVERHVLRGAAEFPAREVPGNVAPGKQSIRAALPLASLDLKDGDVIAYFFSAEQRGGSSIPGAARWPRVKSGLQLVRVRKPVTATELLKSVDESAPALRAVRQLFAAQAELVPRIFESEQRLSLGSASGDRAKELARAQAALAEQAARLQRALAAPPPEPGSASAKAHPPAKPPSAAADARSKIAREVHDLQANAGTALDRGKPDEALTNALDALSALNALEEQVLAEARKHAGGDATASPATGASQARPARTLDAFAREQQQLADALATNSVAVADGFRQQDRIARDLASLAQAAERGGASAEALSQAATSADKAAAQLNEGDAKAAAQPAAQAAQQLREAIARRDADARAEAMERLGAAQEALIHAAARARDETPGGSGPSEARALVAATQAMLSAEAARQEQQGSAAAAQTVGDVAKAIASSQLESQLAQFTDQPAQATTQSRAEAAQKAMALAQAAADARAQLGVRQKLRAEALDALRRDQANAAAAAQDGRTRQQHLAEKTLADAQRAKSAAEPSGGGKSAGDSADEKSGDHSGSGMGKGPLARIQAMLRRAADRVEDRSAPVAGPREAQRLANAADSLAVETANALEGRDLVEKALPFEQLHHAINESGVFGDLREIVRAGADASAASRQGAAAKLRRLAEMSQGQTQSSSESSKNSQASQGRSNSPGTSSGFIRSEGSAASPGEKSGQAAGTRPTPGGQSGRDRKPGSGEAHQGGPANTPQGTQIPGLPGDPFDVVYAGMDALSKHLEGLITFLEHSTGTAPRTDVLSTGNPAEAPAPYRAAVADYFEALSRDATAASPEP